LISPYGYRRIAGAALGQCNDATTFKTAAFTVDEFFATVLRAEMSLVRSDAGAVSPVRLANNDERKRSTKMSGTFTKIGRPLAAGGVILFALACIPAFAQIEIKNEDVDLKLGVQGQFWGDWLQNPETGGYAQNLYLRRGRLMFGGDISDDISFFFQTDDPNLGKTPKTLNTGFVIQDAFLEWKVNNAFRVDGGLMLVPFARQALQATTSFYQIDISNISTVNNSSTASSALRDMGFQARGFLLDDHLLYRMGMFDGERDSNARNSLRTAGYVQYDFFSTETGYSFVGTALGLKKILAVDGGFDKQGRYRSWSGNVASDTPVRHGDEVGVNFQYIHYDGENMFLTIPDQNDLLLELAYYIHRVKFQPFAAVSSQNFVAADSESKDLERYGSGVNYYIRGQHLKWTLQYNRIVPRNTATRPGNEMTMQLQLFYF
jgi:hypothetical protein